MDDIQQALYLIADEIRGMASLTRYYGRSAYHQEKAATMMNLAAKIAAVMDDCSEEDVKTIFNADPWQRFSPAVAVSALVTHDAQELLLVQRSDTPLWTLPGGLVEIGSTIGEAMLKELWEAAGMRGDIRRMLGIFDARLWGIRSKVHLLDIVFQVDCREFTPSTERLDVGFFPVDRLPDLSPGHARIIPRCLDLLKTNTVYFDPAVSFDTTLSMYQRPEAKDNG